MKLKDSEINRLNQEISNLQTLVQIELLKIELANLKMLASEKKLRANSSNLHNYNIPYHDYSYN